MRKPLKKKRVLKSKPVQKKRVKKTPRAVPDDNRRPSEVTDEYFIFAYRRIGTYPKHLPRKGGKWLLFVQLPALDAEWEIIKRATEEAKLGGIAKTATAWQRMPVPR